MSKHQLQRSPIRFKGRADPSHTYLNSDTTRELTMSYDPYRIPEWALEIIGKHKLHERTDDIIGGVVFCSKMRGAP